MAGINESHIINRTCRNLEKIRSQHPLVHNITNYVAMNFSANVLLALGASPVMAHAPEEIDEMVALADALVVNIGTLSSAWVSSMLQAAVAARNRPIPIVFDPVGAGATRFRTESASLFLEKARPAIIRGNASEILAVCGHSAGTRGVDSAHTTDDAASAAESLARDSGTVVAITGPEDFVTDGKRSARLLNGHALMGRVTGTGCAATAIMGAFCAVEPDSFTAAIGALTTFGVAGELAAQSNPGPGTYQMLLLDALDAVSASLVKEKAHVKIIKNEAS